MSARGLLSAWDFPKHSVVSLAQGRRRPTFGFSQGWGFVKRGLQGSVTGKIRGIHRSGEEVGT